MASTIKNALMGQGEKHTVGQINSYEFDTIINGAVCSEDIDNFTLGEIEYKEGDFGLEAHVKKATANSEAYNTVLLVTPEQRLNTNGISERLSDFYNGKGERGTCAILNPNFTFETSAFDKTGVADVKAGQYATWDGSKFKISDTADAGANKLFRVVDFTDDPSYSIDEEELVMLTVLK